MMNLNNILTIDDLISSINIKKEIFYKYLEMNDRYHNYHSFIIPKKDGSCRNILSPNSELKTIQKRIYNLLYDHYYSKYGKSNGVAHAFVKNRGIISNANMHKHKRLLICIDIKDFFDSINFGRVIGYLRKNKCFNLTNEVSFAIAKIACYNNKLPQGSPLSPLLSNLIAQCLDYYIIPIANKYKCVYTRYADDMTFSTNDIKLKDNVEGFLHNIYSCILKSGFEPNVKKTRITYNTSRQKVTGLVTNFHIGIQKEYFKTTRAMCYSYLKTGEFTINGEKGLCEQLLGRLSFVNQIDKFNNNCIYLRSKKRNMYTLNSREKVYRDFLFFEKFYNNLKPLIVTEGKTDILYLKAAIAKSSINPNEFDRKQKYSFEYTTINESKILEYFLGINSNGGSKMKAIYNLFNPNRSNTSLEADFDKKGFKKSSNPIILILDNENGSDRPLAQFKKIIGHELIDELNNNHYLRLKTNGKNVYLVVIPKTKSIENFEIEDLFYDEILNTVINGRMFSRKDENKELYYNKDIFSRYIYRNYQKINFRGFKELLDIIDELINKHI